MSAGRYISWGALAAVLLLPLAAVQAYEVQQLDATLDSRRYRVAFEATLAAPPEAVMAVLTRYEDYPALDPRIRSARIEQDAADKRLVTTLIGCVASWLCRELDRVETLRETPLVLEAMIVAERSDLRYGRTVTTLKPDGAGTHVTYVSEFEFGVFAPGWLVGKPVLEALRDGTRSMFEAVEQRACAAAAPAGPAATPLAGAATP